jgi:hypothetical protein
MQNRRLLFLKRSLAHVMPASLMRGSTLVGSALLQNHVPQVGDGVGEQISLLIFRGKQDQVREAFCHSGRSVSDIDALMFVEEFLDDVIDVAVQTIGHA